MFGTEDDALCPWGMRTLRIHDAFADSLMDWVNAPALGTGAEPEVPRR